MATKDTYTVNQWIADSADARQLGRYSDTLREDGASLARRLKRTGALSHRQIATLMNISPSTVSTWTR